jgi:hypothetical protein
VAVQEQVATVVPNFPAIVADIGPVAAHVRQVSPDLRPVPESQIARQIAPIPPQVAAITPDLKSVGSKVVTVGLDIRAVSVPGGRGNGWNGRSPDDHDRGSERDNALANHATSPIYAPISGVHHIRPH